MARYRLEIEYEGTRYRGWQIQRNARTVQGEIHRALGAAAGEADFEFIGAGRTDAGVHALHQVAHLELQEPWDPDVLVRCLNDELPSDINVISAVTAHPRFHARHHAEARSYLYQISCRRTAFGKRFVWWVKEPLQLDRMEAAAHLFCGMKNFRSFAASASDRRSSLVLVEEVSLARWGELVLVRVVGSHFLWKMVRRMVGVLVEVGTGRLEERAVRTWVREVSAEPARWTAPPAGLFLERVYYPGEPRLSTLEPAFTRWAGTPCGT